jgi:tight adherence protein B
VTARRGAPPRAVALVAAALAVLAALLGPARPATADPVLSATGLRQEPGLVEFFLSVGGLQPGTTIDPTTVAVSVAGERLPVRSAAQVATTGKDAKAPRRLAVLVLDVSGSMTGPPIDAARTAAAQYAAGLPPDVEVAIVAVSTEAATVLAPTADRARVRGVIDGLRADGETALYDGLRVAAGLAGNGRYAERRVLVLSDGADTTSKTPLAAAREAIAAARTPFDTVAFRTEDGTTEVLADLAKRTGGRAYSAADTAALAGAFRSAAGAFAVQLLVTAEVPPRLGGEQVRLEISAQVGGDVVRTSVPARLASDPRAARPPAPAVAQGPPLAVLGGVLGVVFLGLLLVGLMLFSPLLDFSRQRRRLAQVDRFALTPPPIRTATDGAMARAALAVTAQVVRSPGRQERIAAQLERANLRLRPHEWLLIRALLSFAAGVVLALFAGPLGFLAGVVLTWLGTALYRRNRADKRARAFANQLPDALQLIIGSLRSGFSLTQAIEAMIRELADPLSTEFARAMGETRLGVPLEDALERVAARISCADLSWAVVAIRVQREVGGNLAEVLETTVGTMRERSSLHRHVRALSAEGRLSAYVLIALPFALGGFMLLFRRDYLRPLYTQPIGVLMLGVGAGLMAVGAIWMSRMVKIRV